MGSERCVYGPVVAWLVSRGCSAKFGVARSKFALLMRRSVTEQMVSQDHWIRAGSLVGLDDDRHTCSRKA